MIADTGVNALLNTYIIILLISIFISSDTHLLKCNEILENQFLEHGKFNRNSTYSTS